MQPGVVEEIEIALQPTSWLFRKGHRIRVALAGADRDHFERVPAGRFPVLTVRYGEDQASRIVLPVVTGKA